MTPLHWHKLLQPSNAVMAASLLLLAGSIVVLIQTVGWTRAWYWLCALELDGTFYDLRSIQAALDAVDRGIDPRLDNPGDPDGRAMNYPWVWISIARALDFTQETHLYVFGVTMTASFLACCAWLALRHPSWLWLPALASTSVLSAVALGNNDMLIFALVLIATRIGGASGLVMASLAATLKIYPLALLLGGLWPRRLVIAALGVAVLAVGLAWNDLREVAAATPQPSGWAYGTKTIAANLQWALPWWVLSVFVLAMAVAFHRHPVARARMSDAHSDDPTARWMAAGSAVYVLTYLVNSNWDYRLIFLLLVLPWTIERCRGWLRACLLGSILIAMNETWLVRLFFPGGLWLTLFCEAALAVMLCAWLICRLDDSCRDRLGGARVQARPRAL